MIIFPAIDIIGGQCVRLVKGDYATASKVAEDPLETAKKFEAAGAPAISVVTEKENFGGSIGLLTSPRIITLFCPLLERFGTGTNVDIHYKL